MEKVAKWLRRLTNELEPFISKERLQFITEELKRRNIASYST